MTPIDPHTLVIRTDRIHETGGTEGRSKVLKGLWFYKLGTSSILVWVLQLMWKDKHKDRHRARGGMQMGSGKVGRRASWSDWTTVGFLNLPGGDANLFYTKGDSEEQLQAFVASAYCVEARNRLYRPSPTLRISFYSFFFFRVVKYIMSPSNSQSNTMVFSAELLSIDSETNGKWRWDCIVRTLTARIKSNAITVITTLIFSMHGRLA